MDRYLAHEFARVRQEDIRRSVETARTTDVWRRTGHTLSDRIGRTLIHLGARLLHDESTAVVLTHPVPRVAA